MTELFRNFGLLFVWSVFLISVVAEKVLPPENVSLSWSGDLYPELTWTPPKHSLHNCRYHITSVTKENGVEDEWFYSKSAKSSRHLVEKRYLNGGYLNISIKTVCNGSSSEAVSVGLDDPDMKVDCAILSSSRVHCAWKPPSSAQLQLFYNVALAPRSNNFTELRECPHYSEQRNGCDLPVKTENPTLDLSELPINLLLKGTMGNRTIRNVRQIQNLRRIEPVPVKLQPLKWTVKASEENFLIDWISPAFNKNWTYIISYIRDECNKRGTSEIRSLEKPPYELRRQANCSYDISMRGVWESGSTEWTAKEHFDVVSNSKVAMLALVLIPMFLAVLVVLTLFWWMRNKDRIWPKVPQPNSELFEDLMNNNNKANFYLPKAEEECEVTLVIDPKQPGL